MTDGVRAAVDEAIDAMGASAPSRTLPIPDEHVRWACRAVEQFGVLDQLEEWKAETRRGPGGRPLKFPVRALLVAMTLSARLNEPMLATRFRDILFVRISPAMRAELGVPEPPAAGDLLGWEATYKNVRDRLHRTLDLMDPSLTPKNRRLSPAEFEAAIERRLACRPAEDVATRHRRLEWFANRVLEASLSMMSRDVRRRWKGSVAIDATPIKAFARPERRQGRGKSAHVIVHSADPDAGWYVRNPEDRDSETPWRLRGRSTVDWAMEATLLIMGADDPKADHTFPYMVVGMAVLSKPGRDVGENATAAMADVRRRGHPAGWVAGDRAYSNSRPETFQLPAKALGYDVVFDYRKDQLGRMGTFGGAVLVDGGWYCPSLPEALVTATKDYRNGDIKKHTWQQRLEARRAYEFRPKAHADDEGHTRLLCPAAGSSPTARCDLKPKSIRHETAGKTRIAVLHDVRTAPPKVCRQQSVTFPPDAGAKFAQTLAHASSEWQTVYSTLRNTIEGMNGFAKDGAYEALADPQRRRIRGQAAQTVFVALLLFASNLRKIDRFLKLSVIDADGVRRQPRVRRRPTRPIEDWLPIIHSGPDPPLQTR